MSRVSSVAAPVVAAEALLDTARRVATERYRPPDEVTAAARHAAPDVIAAVSPARLRGAIETVIMGPDLASGLQWLHEAGVLGVALPELDATVDFSQEAGRRHKDVWEHTKQVVQQSPLTP